MKKSFLLSTILAAAIFTGCGGGSGASTSSTVESRSISGNAADGYLIGATVCIDANGNLACDEGETTTITGENGYYSFEGVEENQYPIVVEVTTDTIDTDTNETVSEPYVLSTPATNGGFISPLTTSVNEYMLTYAEDNITLENARDLIAQSLGFSSAQDLFTNYMEVPSEDSNLTTEEIDALREQRKELHAIAKLMVYTKEEFKTLIGETLGQSGTQYGAEGLENSEVALNLIANERMREVMPQLLSETEGLDLNNEKSFKEHGKSFANREGAVEDSDRFGESIEKVKNHVERVKSGVSGVVSTENTPEKGSGGERPERPNGVEGKDGERPERPKGVEGERPEPSTIEGSSTEEITN